MNAAVPAMNSTLMASNVAYNLAPAQVRFANVQHPHMAAQQQVPHMQQQPAADTFVKFSGCCG